MSSFNLVQIVPSLNSGGVERGTVDVSNYLSSKNISNHIISSGGNLLNEINYKFTSHCLLPVNSKNFIRYPIIANAIANYIKENKINIKKSFSFPDHHSYSQKDFDKITSDKSTSIVTTKKDYFRLNDQQKQICDYIEMLADAVHE